MRYLTCSLATGLLLLVVACGDDITPTNPPITIPDTFSIIFRVIDLDGQPVEGLRASLSPEVPGLDYPGDQTTIIPHGAGKARGEPERPMVDQLDIFDVEGRKVRQGLESSLWDGRDHRGRPVHDGWYEFRITTRDADSGEVLSVASHPFLYIAADPAWCAAGTSDRAGLIEVADRTYVPGFYDVDPLVYVDEHGNPQAEITLTAETHLTLMGEDGRRYWYTFTAVDAMQTLTVLWNPEP